MSCEQEPENVAERRNQRRTTVERAEVLEQLYRNGFGNQVQPPQVSYRTKDAAFVSTKLPPAEKRAFSVDLGPIDSNCLLIATAAPAAPLRAEERLDEGQGLLMKDRERLQLYRRGLPSAAARAKVIRQQVGAATVEPAPPASPKTALRVRSAHDPEKIRRDDAEVVALCASRFSQSLYVEQEVRKWCRQAASEGLGWLAKLRMLLSSSSRK